MLRNFLRKIFPPRPFSLPARGRSRGTVVLSYQTWPFREGWESPKARGHTNAFEMVTMAEAYQKQGFDVQVVDFTDGLYRPPADTRIAIDIHSNLERWDLEMPPDTLRILHATGPHWLQWNHSELTRLSAVRDRKGIALAARRQADPSRGIEVAHEAVVLGNDYTIESFAFAGKPITRVPISSAYEFSWPEERNFEKARRNLLWVGSYGMVHKGLDLALDAIAEFPELHLTVCGRPEKEEDFFRLYHRELKETPNIHYFGWMDMATPAFQEIARTHAAVLYPSSAEGGAGSVIHCMHAGMLPIVTREASIDTGDFGLAIAGGSVEGVRAALGQFTSLSTGEIKRRAQASYDHVRAHHTRALFQANYERYAESLVSRL